MELEVLRSQEQKALLTHKSTTAQQQTMKMLALHRPARPRTVHHVARKPVVHVITVRKRI